MNKTAMTLRFPATVEGDAIDLIDKAVFLLKREGRFKMATSLKQKASIHGYNFYTCLKLLKQYMEI